MSDTPETKKVRKARVAKERDVRTYATLWSASGRVLAAGLREPKGAAWQFLSSIVLTAFSFEAYLNHAGPTALSSWQKLERLRPEAKLDLLCEVLNVKLPGGKGERPQQTISTLFRFRNTLAHGRTEKIASGPEIIDADKVESHFSQRLLTDWETLVRDSNFALRAREDVKAIVSLIHAALPEPKEHLFTSGFETGSATLLDD